MNFLKKSVLFAVLLMIFGLFSSCGISVDGEYLPSLEQHIIEDGEIVEAKVAEVTYDHTETEQFAGFTQQVRTILFVARIENGVGKGYLINGRLTIDSMNGANVVPVSEGDSVYLYITYDEDGMPWGEFAEYDRIGVLVAAAGVFAMLLFLLGGFKGLRAIAGLLLTCISVFFGFLPMVVNGVSPVMASVIVCAFSTAATLLIAEGRNLKSLSAMIGCICGVLFSAIITVMLQALMHMTGYTDTHAIQLALNMPEGFDMNGLMFAGIIIGAVGATMDVAVSIASSLEELIHKAGHIMHFSELVKSGLKIGRDIMGTMTNTLILAYTGSSLHIMMMIYMNSVNLGYVISWEMLASEIMRALAGSMGLVVVIPATSIVFSFIHYKLLSKNRAPESNETEPLSDEARAQDNIK